MKNMIKAVIFDLNGIFIRGPKLSDRLKEKFGIPTEEFLPVLNEIMAKIRKPKAGDAFNYWKTYLKKWKINLTRDQFFDFWFGAEKEDKELVKTAKQIKNKGIKIFILSNNFVERANYCEQNSLFLKIFNKVYYSWQTGYVKPNPEAFNNLLLEQNFKPEECLYFDNSKENVGVANNLGIKSFIFEGIDSLKKILKDNQII